MKTFNAIAPAKVNLVLDVSPVEPGQTRHNVQTTMQALTLHDTLKFCIAENEDDVEQLKSDAIKLSNQNYGVKDVYTSTFENVTITTLDTIGQRQNIPAEHNLITKAILACTEGAEGAQPLGLCTQTEAAPEGFCAAVPEPVAGAGNTRSASGASTRDAEQLVARIDAVSTNRLEGPASESLPYIHIFLDKQIPSQAGLGGGSSDCAATLRFCEETFGTENIEEIAGELGADVAFFLHGGRAKMSGSGAIFEEQLESLKNPIVLVKPDSGVSTAEAYKLFDENPSPKTPAGEFGLLNSLEDAAIKLNPEVAEILSYLGENSLLCGSGSCCFKICNTFAEASKIAADAALHGWWTRPCYFANLSATLN